MNQQKRYLLLLSALILLIAMIFLQGSGFLLSTVKAEPGVPVSDYDQVEVLILLKDRADTRQAAAQARFNLPTGASSGQEKLAVRRAVFEALNNKAEKTQAPLVKFLEAEQGKGKVSEIKSYYLVNLVYARVDESLVERIARRPDVESVLSDVEIMLVEPEDKDEPEIYSDSIEWNISHIGAPQVWDEFDTDGSGVVVGILDTGVDWQHEALQSKYRGYNPGDPDNPSHAYNWFDPHHGNPYPDDYHGHGSHCIGSVLGSGPDGNNQIGVAPGARWIAARIFDYEGKNATTSIILAGMQYMLAPTANVDGSGVGNPAMAPDIVNNSWGFEDTSCNDILKEAVENWRSAEIMPVFAAGNSGSDPATIGIPANYRETFAVAAVNSSDDLAWFSSRGPSACGDFIKPDISAPGVSIRSVQSYKPPPSQPRDRGYNVKSGTSMAAPHVAGVAALMRSYDPTLTVVELEQIMIETAVPLTDSSYPETPNYGYGYGLVDAYAAVESLLAYTVELYADPPEGGTVSGGGSYKLGEEVTVTAEPAEGFDFSGWTETGVPVWPDLEYTFTVNSDRILTANFQVRQYTLSYSAGENGSVEGEMLQVVDHGGSGTAVEAVPNRGYRFAGWSDGRMDNPRTDTDVTGDLAVSAEFEEIDYDFSIRLNEGWNLLSLPAWADEIYFHEQDLEAWLIMKDGVWVSGDLSEDLKNPARAVFIKVLEPTEVTVGWAEMSPGNSFADQELTPGWNLISTGLRADYVSILGSIIYDGESGLTQIYAPNYMNGRKEEGYFLPWAQALKSLVVLEPDPGEEMFPFDGYWVCLNGKGVNYSTPVSGYLQTVE